MKKIIFNLLCILCIAGCYTQKKAANHADKAYLKFPDMMAQKTRSWFPITITGKTFDSSAYKAWLKEQTAVNDLFFADEEETTEALRDTVIDVWEDSAKIIKLNKQVRDLKRLVLKKDSTIRALRVKLEHMPPIQVVTLQEDSSKMKLVWAENQVFREKIIHLETKIANKILWLKIFAGAAIACALIALILYRVKKKDPPK